MRILAAIDSPDDPQDFSLPWPPHEGPTHCPCGIGPGQGVFMVAERPIRFAISVRTPKWLSEAANLPCNQV